MKKLLILTVAILIILPATLLSQEKFLVEAREDSSTTYLRAMIVDTTETIYTDLFDLYSEQSIQVLTDTLKSGPVALKIELYTSNFKTTPASFKLSQTLIDSTATIGWLSIVEFNTPPARYGQLHITGLTGNDSTQVNIWTAGWSNQPGQDKVLN